MDPSAPWSRYPVDPGHNLVVAHDLGSSLRITRWAYRQVEERPGLVWVRGRELVPLREGWRGVLGGADAR